ncbi:hypothetical protein ApDm4_0597 [Acetobacter pomorum]|nr:hypothetical protein ApDm4_0597 [Acetobacter pomorum]
MRDEPFAICKQFVINGAQQRHPFPGLQMVSKAPVKLPAVSRVLLCSVVVS